MINIIDRHNCCGCSACAQRCPRQCITMHEDEEGFLYPLLDANTCINCGVCETVCPVLNQSQEHKPLECYAAKNPNEDVRAKSSSGGIFLALAYSIIQEGGVVFGARYDKEWEVIHTSARTFEEIDAFRGSKYVQSKIGSTFKEAELYLKEGRKVLFSGTPCQIAALYKYLRKRYDNLLTIDVVCHGVPSPKVWRDYVATLPLAGVKEIRMKDKSTGWRAYSFSLIDSNGNISLSVRAAANKYLMAFTRNLILRPSCFACPAKSGKSQSDITLADYWGIEKLFPSMDDNKGTSFVCANTVKGILLLKKITLDMTVTDYETSIPFNTCLCQSTHEPDARIIFWEKYRKQGIKVLLNLPKREKSLMQRLIARIKKR